MGKPSQAEDITAQGLHLLKVKVKDEKGFRLVKGSKASPRISRPKLGKGTILVS